MNIIYGMIDTVYTLGSCIRHAYGIAAYAADEINDTTTVLCSVHDIISDPRADFGLVEQCNRLWLSPLHLADVVEDYMAG